MTKVRIYGRVVNRWRAMTDHGFNVTIQFEVAYRDYDADTGDLLATGTEDFSPERCRFEQLKLNRYVYTWDGQRRNKGGHRWFEEQTCIGYRQADAKLVKQYLSHKYPAAELIQIRGC